MKMEWTWDGNGMEMGQSIDELFGQRTWTCDGHGMEMGWQWDGNLMEMGWT